MPLEGVALDHVAVAVEAWAQAWPRYVVELGGEWASGGLNVGFGPAQLRFANGARLEVLQPWQSEANPFLRRFLDSNGPGPHHLTFKVPDIAGALDAANEAGFAPVSVDLTDPGWKEAFLHPRQAGGIVVQLAQAAGSWESAPPEGFPTRRPASPASLLRATHAVADLDAALRLYGGLLGGVVEHHDALASAGWDAVTVSWGGPLALRVVAPSGSGTALRQWLGDRPGRLHHLAFAQAGPRTSRGADDGGGHAPVGVLVDDGPIRVVVDPDANLGTRIVVAEPAADFGPHRAGR